MNLSVFEKYGNLNITTNLLSNLCFFLLLSMILFYVLIVFSVCILLSVWVDRSFCENKGRKKTIFLLKIYFVSCEWVVLINAEKEIPIQIFITE